jgi:hypothetical protein
MTKLTLLAAFRWPPHVIFQRTNLSLSWTLSSSFFHHELIGAELAHADRRLLLPTVVADATDRAKDIAAGLTGPTWGMSSAWRLCPPIGRAWPLPPRLAGGGRLSPPPHCWCRAPLVTNRKWRSHAPALELQVVPARWSLRALTTAELAVHRGCGRGLTIVAPRLSSPMRRLTLLRGRQDLQALPALLPDSSCPARRLSTRARRHRLPDRPPSPVTLSSSLAQARRRMNGVESRRLHLLDFVGRTRPASGEHIPYVGWSRSRWFPAKHRDKVRSSRPVSLRPSIQILPNFICCSPVRRTY